MMTFAERPFGELPAALVEEVLQRTENLGQKLLQDFERVRAQRQTWRAQLQQAGWLGRDAELPYVPIPTTCGIDGAYAIERLLTNDLVAAAAVAVEGLTPPSETRHWPEPRHRVWVETETHETETTTILRALMIGMELELAAQAPHEVVFLDGSLTTPLIYCNQALNRCEAAASLETTAHFRQQVPDILAAYWTVLAATRTDRCWLAIPKYTTKREIGQAMGWPATHDDRGLLSFLLEPGEYTRPRRLQPPSEPWHLNLHPLELEMRAKVEPLAEKIIALLGEIQVLYYRPYPWLPALRIEMSRAVAENQARLAIALHGIRHQCGTPAMMEPYPLYMADRMVKHLSKTIPTFRQITSQQIAETYQGNLDDVFFGLHGYRTESGV
ncbi:MAG: DNA double-strand break repair nuclease NurA [Gloeomargarita sp. SKYBB_i_bin120]|nr:DNA double-strand break repair nuclease NurA [Gloeomargarita sp. SKYB120]MDW8178756.1 DNA double-strand break repair nuclease NurA [Gloeomargarita sp. SKYBB_i_bin120]